jgi:tetratricopeptide (TPR) repeat protein
MEQFLQNTTAVINGPEEVAWFAKLDDDLDNLRAAMEWALTHEKPAYVFTAGNLFVYWDQRANYREPLGWLERGFTLEYIGESRIRARALTVAGNFALSLEKNQHSHGYYKTALAVYREIDDSNGVAIVLNNLGNIAMTEKDFVKAQQYYEEALAMGRDPNSWGHAMLLYNLGIMARIRGDWQASRDCCLQALKICEQLGAEAGVSYAHGFMGLLALVQRELIEAKDHFEIYVNASWARATPLIQDALGYLVGYTNLLLGNKAEAKRMLSRSVEAILEFANQGQPASILPYGWIVVDGMARLELMDGRPEQAVQLFGAAWTQRYRDDCLFTEFERPDYEAVIASARSSLGDKTFDSAFQKGQAMSLKEALEFAAKKSADRIQQV